MADAEDLHLRESTGRLVSEVASGTGFFVGPGVVLTCAHVVAPALAAGAPIELHWHGEVATAHVDKILPAQAGAGAAGPTYPYPDLAVISVRLDGRPLMLLPDDPELGAELYAYGYTDEYPGGDSALFVYEGPTSADGLLYRLKDAQARPGLSGAPLLDVARGGIVGIVKRSRDKASDLGGRAIPASTVIAQVPSLFGPAAGSPISGRRQAVSPAVATLDRELDMYRRNLETYERQLGAPDGAGSAVAVQERADEARDTIAKLQERLDATEAAVKVATRPSTLPPRGEFVGRADKLEQLREALGARSPVISVEGMGGVGKTALTLEVAHDSAAEGFEGVVWTSTAPRAVALADLADTIARALDYPAVSRLPEEEKCAELRRMLADHRYLLVLDGFEAVDDASIDAFVRTIPEPNKTVLTSRRAVPDARVVPLRGLGPEEALELLRREAERVGIEGLDDAADDVARLCQLTGGSPLALKWALGLLRQGDELADVLDALESAEGEVFEVILGHTWERLSEPARRVATVLASFAAPTTKQQLQRAAGVTEADLEAAIRALADGSLVEARGSISRRAYTQPPLLRAFARHQLATDPEAELAVRLGLVTAATMLVSECRSGYVEGFDRIEAELTNIFDVVDWCMARERWQDVVDLVDGLAELLWVRGYWAERIKRSLQGLEAARHLGDALAAGRFAYFIGWVHSRWKHQEESLRWAGEVRAALAPVYGDEDPYSLELEGLAAFRTVASLPPATPDELAAFRDGEVKLQRALALFEHDERAPNRAYLVTTVKDNLGELYRDWGRDGDARSCFESVLADAEANQWDERLATANGDLADLAFKAGEYDRAHELYATGLVHALRIKRANTIAQCRLGTGRTLRRKGAGEEAYDHLREALDIYRRLGNSDAVTAIEAELSSLAAELTRPSGGPA